MTNTALNARLCHACHCPICRHPVLLSRQRAWFTAAWAPNEPTRVLTSGLNGEVLEWCIEQRRVLHTYPGTHARSVFNIVVPHRAASAAARAPSATSAVSATSAAAGTPISSASVSDAGTASAPIALTISMDRTLVLWDTSTRRAQWQLPSFGAFVYAQAAAPWSPRLFGAFGQTRAIIA
jgi:hypothetical protein